MLCSRLPITNHYSPITIISKLLQKPHIIAPEITDVANVPAHHGDAFRAHAKSKSTVDFGIVTAIPQNFRVDHTASEDLKPARVLADCAALAAAQEALDIHFRGWLREREVGRAETGAHILPEQTPRKIGEGAFQIAEGDILSDHQPFHLVELDLRACGDLLIPVAHPWQDDPDRVGRTFLHCPDLPWGSMRP